MNRLFNYSDTSNYDVLSDTSNYSVSSETDQDKITLQNFKTST